MTRFVAEFVGPTNIRGGRVVEIGDDIAAVDCACGLVYATLSRRSLMRSTGLAVGDTVSLVVQAGKMRREPRGGAYENRMEATLTGREFTGSQVIYFLRLGDGGEVRMIAQEPFGEPEDSDVPLALYWSPTDVVILGPSIVPGVENAPGGPTYFRLGA